MMRFAWYGRLSAKDKQDPTISFPSHSTRMGGCAPRQEQPSRGLQG
jgi:hypothetical protein